MATLIPPSRDPLRGQHILLIVSLVFLACGAGLVLYTTGGVSFLWAASTSLTTVLGMMICLGCHWGRGKPVWYFFGLMLILTGGSLLTIRAAAPRLAIVQLWPFLMVFAGISIIPAGLGGKKRMKPSLFILSSVFILLGCFFLLFSLKVLKMSLREFLFRLWPVLFIASGAILLGLYLANRIRFAPPRDGEGGPLP